ncbi:tetratricopeptide repeat protein [Bailinhaonella thermotolerans]|uniref:Tetratricopeptide repeat protein n=1 Tax=Bailinhaonella thermotolerans TaxID=1070861 RepID=A0A3A4BF62_9ACTN|nr:tetratricopeptide repeat protein [Bailinhaonella thermotolerans]RJL29982.1 tetratricopeptide repeat protein [Bailinhaonella thermotolerans]
MTVSAMANAIDRRPYVGARPFRDDESDRFFGRTEEAEALAERMLAAPLLILHGPSGAGRTSLLRAGARARVGARRAEMLPVGRLVSGFTFPTAALPPHNPYVLALLSSWAPQEPVARLAGLTLPDYLRRRVRRVAEAGRPFPVLAAVDQAEQLFDRPHGRESDREDLLTQLAEVAAELPQVRLLISVRDEFAGEFERVLGRRERFAVRPFGLAAAREAVVRPVEGTGRWFEDSAAEKLVADLAAPGETVEPALLQIICADLWEALPEDVEDITADVVSRHLDVDRSLASFAAAAVAEVAAAHEIPPGRLAAWLESTFAGEAGRTADLPAGARALTGMPVGVRRELERLHVLRVAVRTGADGPGAEGGTAARVGLQHDRLAVALQRAGIRPVSEPEPDPEQRLETAALALSRGELAMAERHGHEALRLSDDGDLRFRARAEAFLGNLAHARREPGRAEEHYRASARLFEAVQDTPAVARSLTAVGRTLLFQGRSAEALNGVRSAVDRVPGDLSLQVELGRTLWQLGHFEAARAVLTEVLSRDPNAPDALRARGELLADLGRAREALRDLDRVSRHPSPETRAARALALAGSGDHAAAAREAAAALADAPDSAPVLYYAARAETILAQAAGDPTVSAVQVAGDPVKRGAGPDGPDPARPDSARPESGPGTMGGPGTTGGPEASGASGGPGDRAGGGSDSGGGPDFRGGSGGTGATWGRAADLLRRALAATDPPLAPHQREAALRLVGR